MCIRRQAKKFPGYTSENLSEKGVHEVSQRRFVLVAADHPIVSAISENADRLQMGEISARSTAAQTASRTACSRRPTGWQMMPEGLVKISQQLYESILPLVKTQVESQVSAPPPGSRRQHGASDRTLPATCRSRCATSRR